VWHLKIILLLLLFLLNACHWIPNYYFMLMQSVVVVRIYKRKKIKPTFRSTFAPNLSNVIVKSPFCSKINHLSFFMRLRSTMFAKCQTKRHLFMSCADKFHVTRVLCDEMSCIICTHVFNCLNSILLHLNTNAQTVFNQLFCVHFILFYFFWWIKLFLFFFFTRKLLRK
jgi:hypothetical protein